LIDVENPESAVHFQGTGAEALWGPGEKSSSTCPGEEEVEDGGGPPSLARLAQ